jgi:hypothetical protein
MACPGSPSPGNECVQWMDYTGRYLTSLGRVLWLEIPKRQQPTPGAPDPHDPTGEQDRLSKAAASTRRNR